MGRKRKNVIGQRVGKLIALELVEFECFKLWKCQCDCGNTTMLKFFGNIKSCGCLSKSNTDRNPPEIYIKECLTCGGEFKTISKTQKCCNESCGSKLKFLNNPELRKVCSENGRRAMEYIHANGLAYISKPGMHTEEFKLQLSIRSQQPKSDVTKERIKKSHWAHNIEIRQDVIDKVMLTRSQNPEWNNDERRYRFAKWVINNPECVQKHKFYKVGHYYNEFTGDSEYHHSGYELSFMKYLDSLDNVKFWTKKHKIFIEYVLHDTIHQYWPDFLIEFKSGDVYIIELKGYEEDIDKLNAKIAAGESYCKQNNFIFKIIYQKDKHGFKSLRDI